MLRSQIKKDIVNSISNFPFDKKPSVAKALAGWQLTIDQNEVEVSRSDNPDHGDYSTNVALKLASRGEQSPIEFAGERAKSLKSQLYVEKLDVREPGFLNFFVKDEVWQKQVSEVLKAGEKFGSNDAGRGKNARVEFVSANPTGPLHFGNARGGPIGDTLASVLEFSGYKVIREYYHNDVGVQVEKLGQSIVNVDRSGDLGDQEYKGEYIRELIKKIGRVKTAKEAGEKAVEILLKEILKDCEDMGIKFDKVFKESEFSASNQTQKALDYLSQKKVLKKQEGALWFAPSDEFLKDRETVVVKSGGDFTYFANDIAYNKLKFAEKPDLVVDILGSNHHGHVPRLQAVIQSLGFDTDKLRIILYQWVRFKRGSEIVKMSKRSGTFVTAREVLDEVGRDALRFFILMHDANTHIDFDLSLAREKSSKNPVYYVQYAHARIASILRSTNSKFEVRSSKLKTNYK